MSERRHLKIGRGDYGTRAGRGEYDIDRGDRGGVHSTRVNPCRWCTEDKPDRGDHVGCKGTEIAHARLDRLMNGES